MRFVDHNAPILFTLLILSPIIILGSLSLSGCTENQRSKTLGGSAEIRVPCNHVVFDVTWKGDSLWYATQSPGPNWAPETKRFKEVSSLGVLEGEVVLIESRCSG